MREAAAATGEGELLARVCLELRPRVYRFALSRLGDADVAEDIAQETLLVLLSARAQAGGAEAPDSLSSWLFGVARNHINGRFRSARVMRAALASASREPRELVAQPDRTAHARRLLAVCARAFAAELSPRARRIFELRVGEGFSTRAIAAELGCSQDAVRASLLRTRRNFARAHPALAELYAAGA